MNKTAASQGDSARIAVAMKRRTWLQAIPGVAVIPAAAWAKMLGKIGMPSRGRRAPGGAARSATTTDGKSDQAGASATAYELRVYHAVEGKLEDLLARFRDHTMKLFEKHGIKNVAYWLPVDEPLKGKTLIYMLEHPSREAAKANWQAFRDDPEWQSVKSKSEANGPLTEKIDSTFLALTDFSPRVG